MGTYPCIKTNLLFLNYSLILGGVKFCSGASVRATSASIYWHLDLEPLMRRFWRSRNKSRGTDGVAERLAMISNSGRRDEMNETSSNQLYLTTYVIFFFVQYSTGSFN